MAATGIWNIPGLNVIGGLLGLSPSVDLNPAHGIEEWEDHAYAVIGSGIETGAVSVWNDIAVYVIAGLEMIFGALLFIMAIYMAVTGGQVITPRIPGIL